MIHRFSQSDSVVPAQNLGFRSDMDDLNPFYQVHDIDSADIATVHRIAREMIHISGALVKVHPRTNNSDIVVEHDEDPDPTYWASKHFKAFFTPQPLEWELKGWGVDVENNQSEVVFFLGDITEEFNDRLLQVGDLIELPYNSVSRHKPKYYHVNNVQEFGNFRYTWLYLKCQTSLIPGDVNIRPAEDDAEQSIDFEDPNPK